VMMLNPPYGERIDVGGVARAERPGRSQRGPSHGNGMHRSAEPQAATGANYEDDAANSADQPAQGGRFGARELPQMDNSGDFFSQLASHWKKNYAGWTAWMLTPDLKLPGKMRLKESRRVPMWNGPIECRFFRFDMVAGSARTREAASPDHPQPD